MAGFVLGIAIVLHLSLALTEGVLRLSLALTQRVLHLSCRSCSLCRSCSDMRALTCGVCGSQEVKRPRLPLSRCSRSAFRLSAAISAFRLSAAISDDNAPIHADNAAVFVSSPCEHDDSAAVYGRRAGIYGGSVFVICGGNVLTCMDDWLQLLLARGATVPPGGPCCWPRRASSAVSGADVGNEGSAGLEKRKSVKDARLAMSWGGRAEEKGKSKGKAARQVGEKGSVVALKVLAGAAAMRRAGGDEDKVPETAREVLQSIASEEDGAREGDGGGAEEEEKAAQEAPKTGVKDDGYNVGCRVEVYFDDGLWYEGEIVALDAAKGVHSIFFLDGDRQDIALPDPDVRLLT